MEQIDFLSNPATIQQIDPTPLEWAINRAVQPLATPEMIPYNAAYDAYLNMSHVPEERAKQVQNSFVIYLNQFQKDMIELAVNDAQKAALPAELERYRDGYIKRKLAHLAAQSRCASFMITGPANFPVERMRKRNLTENKRREELIWWDDKARKAIRRNIAALSDKAIAEAAERATNAKLNNDFMVGEGFRVVNNWTENRLQILFDQKPDAEMIARLKKSGWRWSPRFGAWQRQLTGNAQISAKAILMGAA
mgnify:CR=1 FL=1